MDVNPERPSSTFWSVSDAAHHLRVHPALIYREIRKGNLKVVRIGAKLIRIADSELEAYLRAQYSTAGES